MLNPDLLHDFMRRFYGYGTWAAKYWFIGMEEGGGDSSEEIERRLDAWDQRGRKELEDLHQYHDAIGANPWSGPRAKIQRTWGKLIRVVLSAECRALDAESVRDYQRSELGRSTGSTALIELLPLPSPSTSTWHYAAAGIDSLATRDLYRSELTPLRIAALRARIEHHQPAAVIFYGISYRAEWEAIIGKPLVSVEGERFLTAEGRSTVILAPHPAARGVTSDDYHAIGRSIASG